jgi:hypothetical protein
MAHEQKPDIVFRRNGRVHLNRRGTSLHSTTGKRGVRISDSNAGYTMFRGSVKSTGYPLHSPVYPSLPLPRVTVCHHFSTSLYDSSCRVSEKLLLYQSTFYYKIINTCINIPRTPPSQPPPNLRSYPYSDVAVALAKSDSENHAGDSKATLRTSNAGQVQGDDPNKTKMYTPVLQFGDWT